MEGRLTWRRAARFRSEGSFEPTFRCFCSRNDFSRDRICSLMPTLSMGRNNSPCSSASLSRLLAGNISIFILKAHPIIIVHGNSRTALGRQSPHISHRMLQKSVYNASKNGSKRGVPCEAPPLSRYASYAEYSPLLGSVGDCPDLGDRYPYWKRRFAWRAGRESSARGAGCQTALHRFSSRALQFLCRDCPQGKPRRGEYQYGIHGPLFQQGSSRRQPLRRLVQPLFPSIWP